MTKRHVTLPDEARAAHREFVGDVDDRLSAASTPGELADEVAVTVAALHGDRAAYEAFREDEGADVAPAERARLTSYHPRNATLESEYYADKDEAAFERSKPLQWLWRQFDNSPMADDVDLGHAFRSMLADHLFAAAGENLRIFRGVTMTYGHNITLGDNVVVHDDVHLDDRGELAVGDRVSLSEGAHIYTHDHDIVDQTAVTNYRTVVGDDARITFDAMVQAGVEIGRNAVVAARSVVQKDVPDHHIAGGVPAKSIGVKPGWESVAEPVEDATVDRRGDRTLPSTVPDDVDVLDEFQRDLHPPDAPETDGGEQ